MFFLLQRCSVLLVRGVRSAYWPSLYVDRNGEEHRGAQQRGLPLLLDRRRYAKVEELYAAHLVSVEVSRKRNQAKQVIRDGWY